MKKKIELKIAELEKQKKNCSKLDANQIKSMHLRAGVMAMQRLSKIMISSKISVLKELLTSK